MLPALVRDVAAQDHRAPDGTPWFELVVVDDRSVDGSGDAVRDTAEAAGIGAVTRIIRRDGEGLPDGKGAALSAAQPEICRGDMVVVLDADARIGPGFLGRLAAYVNAGADALTARRRMLDAKRRLARRRPGRRADARRRDPARSLVTRRLLGVPGQRDRRPARPAGVGRRVAARGVDRGSRPVEPARGGARDRGRLGDRRRGLGGARAEPRRAVAATSALGGRRPSPGARARAGGGLEPGARPVRPAGLRRLRRPAVHPAGHPRDGGRCRRAGSGRPGGDPRRDVPRGRWGAGVGRAALGDRS